MIRKKLTHQEFTFFIAALTVVLFFAVLALQSADPIVGYSYKQQFENPTDVAPPSFDRAQNQRYRAGLGLDEQKVAIDNYFFGKTAVQVSTRSFDERTACLLLRQENIPIATEQQYLVLDQTGCVVLEQDIILDVPLIIDEQTALDCNGREIIIGEKAILVHEDSTLSSEGVVADGTKSCASEDTLHLSFSTRLVRKTALVN